MLTPHVRRTRCWHYIATLHQPTDAYHSHIDTLLLAPNCIVTLDGWPGDATCKTLLTKLTPEVWYVITTGVLQTHACIMSSQIHRLGDGHVRPSHRLHCSLYYANGLGKLGRGNMLCSACSA